MIRTIIAVAIVLGSLTVAGCNAQVGDPWVSGSQAEQLEAERTRTTEQRRELIHRLQRYGSAYQ